MRRRPTPSSLLVALARGCARRLRDLRPLHAPSSRPASTATERRPPRASPTRDPAPERGGTIPPARAPRRTSWRPAPRSRRRRRRSSGTPACTSTGPRTPSPKIQRQLAAISIGQARAQALQAAASYTPRPDTRAERRRQQRPARRDHPEPHDAPGSGCSSPQSRRPASGDYSGLPPTLHVIYAQSSTRTAVGLGGERMGTAELSQPQRRALR